jgi:hypothetical protein
MCCGPVIFTLDRMKTPAVDWPDDADGDALRRLVENGFDFEESWLVDFNVDFEVWPPAKAALEGLESEFGQLAVYAPEEGSLGYVQFQVRDRLSYESVTSIQRRATAIAGPFAGVCESWGVLS